MKYLEDTHCIYKSKIICRNMYNYIYSDDLIIKNFIDR